MRDRFILTAAVFGMLGVALGAFGAHGLEATLTANGRADTFDTAVQYHLFHAVALLGVAWLTTHYPPRLMLFAGGLFAVGIVLFSGSLYVLAIFDLGIMGAVAPLGGTAFVVGWGLIAYAAFRESVRRKARA